MLDKIIKKNIPNFADFIRASQAFATLGMISLVLAMFASFIYMLIHRVSKSHVLAIIFAAYIVAGKFGMPFGLPSHLNNAWLIRLIQGKFKGKWFFFPIAALFLTIAIAVYGAEMKKNYTGSLSYSYAFTVIGTILALGGGVFAFIQMERSGMIVC